MTTPSYSPPLFLELTVQDKHDSKVLIATKAIISVKDIPSKNCSLVSVYGGEVWWVNDSVSDIRKQMSVPAMNIIGDDNG